MLKKLLNFIQQKIHPAQICDRLQTPELLEARAELVRLQDEMMLALLADGTTENVSSAQIEACGRSLRQKRHRISVRMNPEPRND